MGVTLQLNCNVSCCDTKGYKIYRITKIPFIDTMEWCLQLLNEEAISTFNSTFFSTRRVEIHQSCAAPVWTTV